MDDGFGSGTWGEMILGLLGLTLENDSIMQGANWGKEGLHFLWLSPPSTIRPHWGGGDAAPGLCCQRWSCRNGALHSSESIPAAAPRLGEGGEGRTSNLNLLFKLNVNLKFP